MAAANDGTNGVVVVEDGNPRFKPEEPVSVCMRIMDIVNTVTHLALGAVAFSIIFIAVGWGNNKYSQHMILCVIGYVILMAQAILVMSPNNGWSRSIRYQDRKTVHLVLHVLGSILALVGGIIIITEKYDHFNTTHGCLGLVAMILTVISLVGGLIHLFACLSPRITCILHSVVGSLTMIIAFMAIIFGVDYLFSSYGDASKISLIFVIVIGLIGTLLSSCLKLFRGCT